LCSAFSPTTTVVSDGEQVVALVGAAYGTTRRSLVPTREGVSSQRQPFTFAPMLQVTASRSRRTCK
jgi:hypothetical protein